MEEVLPSELEYLDALPVSTRPADTIEGNFAIMRQILGELGLADKADELIDLFCHVHPMRGAVLYDIATGQHLEPDQERGIRVTYMDAEAGFAASSKIIIEYLKNKARSFIFATSQAPSTLGAALAALRILESEPQHAQALQHNANFFLDCLHKEGVQAQSPTAIIPIIIGDEATALKVADELLSAGILVPAIRYPTVAKGTARLRVALMSSHTEEELAR